MNKPSLIYVAILAVLLSTGFLYYQGVSDRASERPDVVLVTFEATPADKLPCYGYHRNTTPNLCEFAEEATRYENAYATSGWTPLSFSSISTGKYPFEVGVYSDTSVLTEDHTLLAERLQSQGYRTMINPFVHHLPKEKGFLRGYSQTRYDISNIGSIIDESDKPIFAREHIVTPHYPYAPLEEYREENNLSYVSNVVEYDGETPQSDYAPQEVVQEAKEEGMSVFKEVNETERERINDIYDETLRSTDLITFDAIINELKESESYEDSLIIFVADHGEETGENGLYGHNGPYQQNLRIPLLVKYPDQSEGRVSQRLVSQIDIYPTILDVAGVPIRDEITGKSMLSGSKHEYVVAQDAGFYAGMNRTHKMVWCQSINFWCTSENMFIDIASGSDKILGDSNHTDFEEMKDYIRSSSELESQIGSREEIEDRLRELGYVN